VKPLAQSLVGAFGAFLPEGAGPFGGSPASNPNLVPFGSAMGNAFLGGSVTAFALGGVVHRPTLFPMASGMGLMGERGPEAVMPLQRLPSGRLGVEARGSSLPPIINVITDAPGGSVETRQRQTPTGQSITDVIISTVRTSLGRGELDPLMRARYNMRPATQRR
jgi:hypothetical protein